MLLFCLIQSTFYSPSRELLFCGTIGIVNRYIVSVKEAGFRRIRLFLLCVLNSVSRTEGFKLSSQLPKWDLNKILVVRPSNINFLFNTWVIPNNQFAYLILKAMVNYRLCCFIQATSNAVTAPLIKSSLSSCERLNTLLVLERLRISVLFVVPLINAFKSLPINQLKRE